MAEKKKSENKLLNSASGIFKKKQTSKNDKKTAKTSSSVHNAKAETELQKTKEIRTVASASAAVKDRKAENKISAATASTKSAKPKKEKEKRLGPNWFFWIVLILIIIPSFYFVKLLHDASLESNVPVVGERLKHNIKDQITEEMKGTISTAVSSMENVELSETNLIVDTLRINVDVKDELTADQMKQMTVDIYNKVAETAPIETYFTQHDEFKQYDLEINIFNNLDVESPIIVSLYRNSHMDKYNVQVLTSPLNSTVAEKLKIRIQEELEERERERQEAEAAQNAEDTESTETTEGTESGESGEQTSE